MKKTINEVDTLPQKILDLSVIIELENKYAGMRKKAEDELLRIMKENALFEYESGGFVVERTLPGTTSIIDGDTLRKEIPEAFIAYSVAVPVKEGIVWRKKK